MAQLKDLIVTGATRLIGNVYAGTIQITTLNAPTVAGGTIYGPGTNGYVLKSNGSSVYWGSDNNSVTGVKGNAESSYRTGQVNLTPANIGALPLAGGKMIGAISWASGSISEFSSAPTYLLGIEAFADGGATKWKAASRVNVGSADSAKWLMNRGTNVTIGDSSWAHGQKGRGGTNTSNGIVWKQKWTQSGLTYTPSGGSATTLSDSGDIVYWLSQDTTSNNLWVNMAIDGYIYSHSGFKALTQSAGYSEGIRFVNSSGADKGSIGCDTNGVLGLYGSSKVTIRPVINAATDGIEITTTSMVPTKATVALGTAANPWHNLVLGGTTNATMTAASANPRITFQEGTGTQPVHLIYTDQDSYRNPAGLKVIGGTSATPAWFEVEGNIYAAAFKGNSDTATKLATARTISLTGSVTGSGSFDGSGNLSIATTTNHHHNTLTVGNKTYNGSSDVTIEIADLGLASTTTFLGLTSTNLSNGSTTNPVTITVGPTTGSVTATNGGVVMEASTGEEYIWSGNKWNLMGLASSWALANHIHGNITNAGTITSDTAKASGQHLVITDSNNKICRSAITLGTATNTYLRNDGTWATPTDTNKYHKTGSWSGLTYTATAVNSADELKFTVPSASTSAAGAVQLSSATNSTSTTLAATASAVKAAYDLANGKVSRSGDTMTGTLTIKGLKGTSGTDYGTTLPSSGETGQIFFLADDSGGVPSGGTTGQFLRGDGVWQNTLTDSFIVSKSGTAQTIIRSTNDNGSVELLAGINRGLYDRTNTKWAIAVNADGTKVFSDYPIYGAVWNDYAEYRASNETEAGRCVREVGDGTLIRTTERLQKGCEIVSDTFGFAIGKTEKYNTPTAASGRVLAYLYEDKEIAKSHIGDPVCSGPNGTVSIMTEEEEMRYPSRIIGTISEIPDYEIWEAGHNGDHQIEVNGRVWIRVR